jgi:hypothetical protein
MVDRRRDKTEQIPASTIAELLASRKKLAPRQETTDLTGAARDVRAALEENEQQMLRMLTKAPVPREELEAQLGPHLEPFSPARRTAVLQAFQVHAYARGIALLDEDVRRQPRNLSMTTEARALRLLVLSRLETEIGGLHVVPRVAKPLSTIAAPPDLENLLPFIDGHSPIERILRLSKIDRLRGLDFLASLARSGHIDLPVTTVAEPEPLSIAPLSSRSQTRPKAGSNPPPPQQASALEPLAEVVQASPTEHAPAELIPLEPVRAMGPAPSPAPGGLPPEVAGPAAAVESEPPSSRAAPVFAASSRTLRQQAPMQRRGLHPALFVALGAVVMVAIIVGIAAFRRDASQSLPATPTASTAAAPAPTPSPEPAPQPKPIVTTAEQAAPKTDAPGLASIRVKIKVQPSYARVTVDGVVFTGSDIEVNLAKDTKQHVLKVDAPGYKPHSATFTAEESASFTIALERLPPRH